MGPATEVAGRGRGGDRGTRTHCGRTAVPDVSNVTGITTAVNRYGPLPRNELGDGDIDPDGASSVG